VRQAVHGYDAADDRRIAGVAALPDAVAQQQHARPAGRVLLGPNLPAQNRLDAEHREHVGGDRRAVEPFRLVAVGERQAAAGHGRHLGEHAGALLPVLQIAIRHIPAVDAVDLVRRIQPDQRVGVAKRQRPDRHRVDDAEDRAVDADAERQAEDRQRREPGFLASVRAAYRRSWKSVSIQHLIRGNAAEVHVYYNARGTLVTAPLNSDVTGLLASWADGDRHALDQLMPLVYEELRRLAHRELRHEGPEATLVTTALVHEAYLRLVDQKRTRVETRAHFLNIAAQMMRRVVVDTARKRRAGSAGPGRRDCRWTMCPSRGSIRTIPTSSTWTKPYRNWKRSIRN
jgi:hypothetical protein